MSKDEAINLLKNADLTEKSEALKTMKIYYHIWKRSKEIIDFGNIEIQKRKFHQCKNLISLQDVDIDNMYVPGMVSPGEKIINILLVIKMIIIKINHYA